MKVLAVCGALSAGSLNRQALRWAAEAAPAGVVVTLDEGLGQLPLFNPDLEKPGPPPHLVQHWRSSVSGHDALLVACPEYGFSLPGALKNGIDWLIGSGELEGKAVATFAIVAGEGRGYRGLEALHATLGAVSANVYGGRPIVRWHDEQSSLRVRRELTELLRLLQDGRQRLDALR